MSDNDTAVIATILGLAAIALYFVSTKTTVGQVVTKVQSELGDLAETLLPTDGSMKTVVSKSRTWQPTDSQRIQYKRTTHAPPSKGIATDNYLHQAEENTSQVPET